MREIKFRGMDIHGRWFYGNLAILTRDVAQGHKKGHYISNSVGMPFAYQVRPETVSQYTGLHDKNGKEIYEGDIVLNDDSQRAIVRYDESNAHYYLDLYELMGSSFCVGIEKVIGNIYENPELIEEESA